MNKKSSLVIAQVLCLFSPVGICLVKVDNRNAGTSCEICSKLAIKTSE